MSNIPTANPDTYEPAPPPRFGAEAIAKRQVKRWGQQDAVARISALLAGSNARETAFFQELRSHLFGSTT
jgi:hypothetical protein